MMAGMCIATSYIFTLALPSLLTSGIHHSLRDHYFWERAIAVVFFLCSVIPIFSYAKIEAKVLCCTKKKAESKTSRNSSFAVENQSFSIKPRNFSVAAQNHLTNKETLLNYSDRGTITNEQDNQNN